MATKVLMMKGESVASFAKRVRANAIRECAEVCRQLEKKLEGGSLRNQHHHGAYLGASMCAERIERIK